MFVLLWFYFQPKVIGVIYLPILPKASVIAGVLRYQWKNFDEYGYQAIRKTKISISVNCAHKTLGVQYKSKIYILGIALAWLTMGADHAQASWTDVLNANMFYIA